MSITKGQQCEQFVKRWLIKQGWQCINENYRCRFGEIDLIMHKGKNLIFVEVKFRTDTTYGTAQDFITLAKQQKLILCAKHFLMHEPKFAHYQCRFDAITINKKIHHKNIEWIPNAFET